MTLERTKAAGTLAVALVFLVWAVVHLFTRICTRAGCADSPLTIWFVGSLGGIGEALRAFAVAGEVVLGVIALAAVVAGLLSR